MTLIRRYPLPAYFVLACLITWVLVSPLVFAALGWIGPVSPGWHALGALGPLSAALLVTWAVNGEVQTWLSGLWRWQRTRWGGFWVFVSPFVLAAGAVLAVGLFTGAWPRWEMLSNLEPGFWWDTLGIASLAYGLGEEPGWRGFALPRLQQRYRPLTATLLLTPVWAAWHLPFFAYRYPDTNFVAFAVGLLAGAIFLTFLYNLTGGSVLACVVWHWLNNVLMVGLQAVSLPALAAMNALLMAVALGIVIFWLRRKI